MNVNLDVAYDVYESNRKDQNLATNALISDWMINNAVSSKYPAPGGVKQKSDRKIWNPIAKALVRAHNEKATELDLERGSVEWLLVLLNEWGPPPFASSWLDDLIDSLEDAVEDSSKAKENGVAKLAESRVKV